MTTIQNPFPSSRPGFDRARERVVVAMSGGVDSSVAAALLVEQGYDVVGMMMRLWSESDTGSKLNRCCTPDQMADARRVAERLGIPFYVLDVQDYFRQTVVQFFIDEHAAGRTPNPCLECNRKVRFSYLLARALALGAQFLATGHYARVERSTGGYRLLKAVDQLKDQSYVLHILNQDQLAQVKFPVGSYTKDEVRQLATKFGLPVAKKSESMDLCFLADGDYRRFLDAYAPQIGEPGPIIDSTGRVLGEHLGLANYTIGQRKGLGIAAGEPLFVLKKDVTKNTLSVGTRPQLGKTTLTVRDVCWVAGSPPRGEANVEVKIRYRARPIAGRLICSDSGLVQVEFEEPVYGATPGQGAVFYLGDVCLGGGIIDEEGL
jgi:tRNA-specific 2-thiouridylase